MKKNMFYKKAFTLLEMLVVLGIIAIIVSVTVASYGVVQKKARDSKRKSDLKAVQNCMEQYYTTNSYKYQALTAGSAISGSINCGSTSITAPTDPLSSGSYIYNVNSTSTSDYTITATLEGGGTFVITNLQ